MRGEFSVLGTTSGCPQGPLDGAIGNALHDLLDIIVITLATILCGEQGATDMEVFASSKEKLLRQLLQVEHGVSSHDTFSRVLNALDPVAFEQAFRCFMAAPSPRPTGSSSPGMVVDDGEAVRGAYERGRRWSMS
ncbi:transposase family protein [Bradyrhizobium sp. ISRA442]|uniref:transposase family protein n=1 Tax=Bradyrhizobium sp. ISRA442 TaxID=2866197 RepID=UPI00404A2326